MASEGGAGGATKDVEVLMAVPDVRVFRLTREAGEPGGFTTETITEGELLVLHDKDAGDDSAFLMVRDFPFSYPLVKGAPVLVTGARPGRTLTAPISADASETMGLSIGARAPDEVAEAFVALVATICDVHAQEAAGGAAAGGKEAEAEGKGGEGRADKAAALLEAGAAKASAGIVGAGKMMGSGLRRGGGWLKTKVKPRKEATVVSARTRTAIASSKAAVASTVAVSAAVQLGMATTATNLARAAAAGVASSKYGAAIKKRGDSDAGQAAKKVASAGVVALTQVIYALDEATVEVVKAAGGATAEFVDHRYGEDAGAAAREAAGVASDLNKTRINVARMGPTALARAAATDVAKEGLGVDTEKTK